MVEGEKYTTRELSDLFGCKIQTLKRHARELYGIDLSANKGRGKIRKFSKQQSYELFVMAVLTWSLGFDTVVMLIGKHYHDNSDTAFVDNSTGIDHKYIHMTVDFKAIRKDFTKKIIG